MVTGGGVLTGGSSQSSTTRMAPKDSSSSSTDEDYESDFSEGGGQVTQAPDSRNLSRSCRCAVAWPVWPEPVTGPKSCSWREREEWLQDQEIYSTWYIHQSLTLPSW